MGIGCSEGWLLAAQVHSPKNFKCGWLQGDSLGSPSRGRSSPLSPSLLSLCLIRLGLTPQVGDARLTQDHMIAERFVNPWQATLSTSIGLAMKARANVKMARLELDSARGALKAAGPTKQEQAR